MLPLLVTFKRVPLVGAGAFELLLAEVLSAESILFLLLLLSIFLTLLLLLLFSS